MNACLLSLGTPNPGLRGMIVIAGPFRDDGNGAPALSASSRHLTNHLPDCFREIFR